ncbi:MULTISPECIES: winged helix-turn-helix transcriptional regulator [Chryseobacterium]|uniref:winged helix-turn-helix transcriptional regulator n=1 Tax=Chryseobacterium TaxID=59732 RepID=UPI001109F4CC|nr:MULTISPECIES: helix-turn-helix domain-containing protein [Chryseobacterium]MBF6643880.1 helix-turn-helix transcriptional regulator [Chryseobacterium indologenes]MBU3047161.1 helix-turn-helix transcriptional regulator [Chryseobacterium indologenes]QQQ72393.1 helix-turn-helix transcriptional regulator [Chryseobacterium indologenes]TLX26620.1 helix-turn-helix transcriptional regulator [Chryseobacterium indologenes]WET50787.1 helix-turn-helix domain-containing protein [Chryseobacterium indologe
MDKKEIDNEVNKEFTEDCTKLLASVSDALYAIGGKWKLMIIIAMARGNHRFTELQRQVKGISARVLSSELKELELNGFIIKKVSVGYPVTIEYELLPYSHTLEELVGAMSRWGIQHREKIKSEMSAGS